MNKTKERIYSWHAIQKKQTMRNTKVERKGKLRIVKKEEREKQKNNAYNFWINEVTTERKIGKEEKGREIDKPKENIGKKPIARERGKERNTACENSEQAVIRRWGEEGRRGSKGPSIHRSAKALVHRKRLHFSVEDSKKRRFGWPSRESRCCFAVKINTTHLSPSLSHSFPLFRYLLSLLFFLPSLPRLPALRNSRAHEGESPPKMEHLSKLKPKNDRYTLPHFIKLQIHFSFESPNERFSKNHNVEIDSWSIYYRSIHKYALSRRYSSK